MRCDGVQMANVLLAVALFYACIFPFITFFGSFAFVLYPLRDVLQPTGGTVYPLTLCCTYVYSSVSMAARPMVAMHIWPMLSEQCGKGAPGCPP